MVVKQFHYDGNLPIGDLSEELKDALRSAGVEIGVQSLTRAKGSENTNLRMKSEGRGWVVRVQSDSQKAVDAVSSVLGNDGMDESTQEDVNGPMSDEELEETLHGMEKEQHETDREEDDEEDVEVSIYGDGDYHIDYGDNEDFGNLGVAIVGDLSSTRMMVVGDDFGWTDGDIERFTKRISDELKELKER